MRRARSQSPADVDAVDVLLVEDDEDVAVDEVRAVLHELALEAMARRATWAADLPSTGPYANAADLEPAPVPVGLVRRLALRYRRRAAAGAVLAVAVAATTGVVDARQTAARAAALSAVPAVLAEASRPPAEVWRVPGRIASDQHDALLVVDGGTLRGVDPATGETLWTASAAAGRAASTGGCVPVDEGLRPDRAPVPEGSGPRGLVACVAHGPANVAVGDGAERVGEGVGVVVLDPTTGRTRHTFTADGVLLLAEPAGRDLVVATALADDRVRITRWELETGTAVWDAVSPVPVLTDPAADVVRRRPASWTIASFAVAGARPYPYEEHALPNDARATWSWHDDGTSGQGRVAGGDAHSWYPLPGPPLRPPITDGTDRGVLVVRAVAGDRLRGLDLRGGRMRWTEAFPDAPALRATTLVEGVMLLQGRATATAVDVRTGDRLWATQAEPAVTGGLGLTDGEVVLLPVRAGDDAMQLTAHRIADGTPVWGAELPPGTVSMTVVDHHLVAVTDDEVVGLG